MKLHLIKRIKAAAAFGAVASALSVIGGCSSVGSDDVAIVDAEPLLPVSQPAGTVLESDWMRARAGASETRLGARVESVERSADGSSVAVRVSLPESDTEIEEVVVYGRTLDKKDRRPIIQPMKIETLSSPERNGIVIYLPNEEDFVLRVNYFEPQPDVIPDRINE